jgi:excisionase family DNA binding protein
MPDGWLTTKDAAKIMRVKDSRVRQLCVSGEVDAEMTGRIWLVREESAMSYNALPNRKPRKKAI